MVTGHSSFYSCAAVAGPRPGADRPEALPIPIARARCSRRGLKADRVTGSSAAARRYSSYMSQSRSYAEPQKSSDLHKFCIMSCFHECIALTSFAKFWHIGKLPTLYFYPCRIMIVSMCCRRHRCGLRRRRATVDVAAAAKKHLDAARTSSAAGLHRNLVRIESNPSPPGHH